MGTDEVGTYFSAVKAALADLPEEQRAELLEDLPQHLSEVLAENGGPLVGLLGTPEAYAAELRTAAGTATGDVGRPPGRRTAWSKAVRSRLGAADARLGPAVGTARVSDFAAQLRPAWWVLRGYVVAMLIAAVFDESDRPIGLLPRIGGSVVLALGLLAVCVVGSVWLGRRSVGLARGRRYVLRSATVLVVIAAAFGFAWADSGVRAPAEFQPVVYDDASRWTAVHDIFVYDQQGFLQQGVRLFDQDGRLIAVSDGICYSTDPGSEGTPRRLHSEGTYPICPERAPFSSPEAVPGPVPSGSSGPGVPAAPPAQSDGPAPGESPAPTGSPAPSGSAAPSPS